MLRPYRIDSAEDSRPRISRPPIVLARLPYVGVQSSFDGRSYHLTAVQSESSEADSVSATTESRAVSLPFANDRLPQQAAVNREIQADSRQSEPSPARQEFHRTDEGHADPHAHRHPFDHPTTGHPVEPSGLFQIQKQLATNSGLIVALALLASAALLYLTLIAPIDSPTIDYTDSYQFYGAETTGPSVPSFNDPLGMESDTAPAELAFDPFAIELDGEPVASSNTIQVTRDVTSKPIAGPTMETASDSGHDALRLPDLEEASEVDDVFRFDDASASAYPSTSHPTFDIERSGIGLGVSNSLVSPSSPAFARRPQASGSKPANH